MQRRIPLRLIGIILAPTAIAAFVIGIFAAGIVSLGHPQAAAKQEDFGVDSGPPAQGGGPGSFAAVADRVIPAVVNIAAEKKVAVGRRGAPEFGGPLEDLFREFFRDFPDMPRERQRNALGSGVIIDADGYIVTNNHVVSGFDELLVRLSDGTEIDGEDVEIVGRDPKTDLAVIRVKTDKKLPFITYGDVAGVRVGDWAVAVGNAFGLQSTVTVGVISAKGRTGIPLPEGPSYQDFLQTDASINPGNSGGALVNTAGELIGINTAIRSPVGASVGVGFAVPVDMVRSVTSQLIQHGKVVRGFLGIRPQEITESIRKAKKLEDTGGVLVAEVIDDTPAQKSGLKPGDIIVELEGRRVETVEQFRRHVADLAPGTTISMRLKRDGKTIDKKVKLVEFPEDDLAATEDGEKPGSWFGLDVRNLTSDERDEAGVSGGVVVVSVEPGKAADDADIRQGDIILEVGDTRVVDLDDYNRAVQRLVADREPTLLRLQRGSVKMYVAVEP
ncbi:MAG: Do family serine endopeptidase [candidate division WOR-3 bacterium]|nr:MAG: Do family serine endopeptidase [candidate division WOR-3 bacterium]